MDDGVQVKDLRMRDIFSLHAQYKSMVYQLPQYASQELT